MGMESVTVEMIVRGDVVTEQRVTALWSFVVSDPDFCDHHWFGYALLSFTAGMHGGYVWRIKEAHCE
jgi:hypothetical protein